MIFIKNLKYFKNKKILITGPSGFKYKKNLT
jgi:hypothetical protein